MSGVAVQAVVRSRLDPAPPPLSALGPVAWVRERLLSSPLNIVITLALAYLAVKSVVFMIDWAFVEAVWTGDNAKACPNGGGACWAYVTSHIKQIIYGSYPIAELWRVNIVFALAAVTLVCFLVRFGAHTARVRIGALIAFPIVACVLLVGNMFGLRYVETSTWGGLLLTLVVASCGVLGSMPLGALLALARFAKMPALRWTATLFIEFWRAVPLIAALFAFVVCFPLFLPGGKTNIDLLLRTVVGFAVFNSAFMAEVFRGGLQSVPRGQFEAAESIGLTWRQMMIYIVLPQAVRNCIPALVNTSISIFKETAIVLLIGLSDLLGVIQTFTRDPTWLGGPQVLGTGYVFAALIYMAFTFSMSRLSRRLENRQNMDVQ